MPLECVVKPRKAPAHHHFPPNLDVTCFPPDDFHPLSAHEEEFPIGCNMFSIQRQARPTHRIYFLLGVVPATKTTRKPQSANLSKNTIPQKQHRLGARFTNTRRRRRNLSPPRRREAVHPCHPNGALDQRLCTRNSRGGRWPSPQTSCGKVSKSRAVEPERTFAHQLWLVF